MCMEAGGRFLMSFLRSHLPYFFGDKVIYCGLALTDQASLAAQQVPRSIRLYLLRAGMYKHTDQHTLISSWVLGMECRPLSF